MCLPLVFGLAVGAGQASAEETGSESELCGPFQQQTPRRFAQAKTNPERGIDPVRTVQGATPDGQIVTLPSDDGAPPPGAVDGEALLALPKGPGGKIPRDFELADGVHIAESYFSPVLCATVARIAGPPGLEPEQLVSNVPEEAALVPNYVYVTAADELQPVEAASGPDPYRRLQWGMDATGVEAARDVTRGATARVAILDSAPERAHRDLGNTTISALEGSPSATPGSHGTLMTGIVAAVEGNAFGIAGMAPEAEVVAIPVCRPAGSAARDRCELYRLLEGLDLAWSEQAQILNLSIVGPDNPLLSRGMARLDELGAVVVAAAGNEGTAEPRYPAAYASVIGVGALDREGGRYARSNRGPSAELLAPGVEILSTVPGDAFAFGSGTSFAASHVSATFALLLGAGLDVPSARTALFHEMKATLATAEAELPPLPKLCSILARAGRPCP